MFPWKIAKSAEAMLSRFAIKRLCKFLLKKKLGQFIHGDIDLDQLDVQLAAGTLQLSELALNVDYLNEKLGSATAIRVREGSMASVLVRMPWSAQGCEIEIDELELVFASCDERLPTGSGNGEEHEHGFASCDTEKDDHDNLFNFTTASINIHEGVKTVAKMVKWLLTRLHVKIRKVIVAFDPYPEDDELQNRSHKTMVLRISEIECGTCISEDVNSSHGAKADDFLCISHLTNFLKFQGAILELLQVDCVGEQRCGPSVTAATFTGRSPSNATTPVLTGESGGFSGNLNLSIPWKNGSLDIRKLDADLYIDPIKVKLQNSTLKWFLFLWGTLEKNAKGGHSYHKAADSFSSCLTSWSPSSDPPTTTMPDDKFLNSSFHLREAVIPGALLQESCLISDWVPLSVGKSETDTEADLGASIDQFFECFDEMRSSQSVLGSSGMWNWTCSVFSAITAASNLASGSLSISPEQQHAQTNLRVTFAGVTTIFSLIDEDMVIQDGPSDEPVGADSHAHYLESRWQDILIVVQVSPQEWKSQVTVKHIDLDDCFTAVDHEMGANSRTLMIRRLQGEVQSALPSSFFAEPNSSLAADAPLSSIPVEECATRIRCESEERNIIKAKLFESFGMSHFQFVVNSRSSNGCFTGPASFSLKLPPFIFWVNFDLVDMVLDISRGLVKSSEMDDSGHIFASEAFKKTHGSSADGSGSCDTCPTPTATSLKESSWEGNIFLPNARVILCFNSDGLRSYNSWNEFIALDFSAPSNLRDKLDEGTAVVHRKNWKKQSPSTSSLHLNAANADIYLIIMASEEDDTGSSVNRGRQRFFAQRFFSLSSRMDWLSLISMVWHQSAVTGAWIVKSAKLLASADDSGTKFTSATNGHEFAAVTSRKNIDYSNSRTRKEMILSSKFLLHFRLPPVVLSFSRSQYVCLYNLLNQVIHRFSCATSDSTCDRSGTSTAQTSVFVECDQIEILAKLDPVECSQSSLLRELPGSWHNLRLKVQSFQLLSISNIGANSGASFLWVTHGEGELWGSITGISCRELLLISCNNNNKGRGCGEGSNTLFCRPAGFDLVHMSDPESSDTSMSITVKCATLIAPGGRLDWIDRISSFFSLPTIDSTNTFEKDDCQTSVHHGSSIVLKFIDVGLSYEPCLKEKRIDSECSAYESDSSGHVEEESCEPYIGCLLAASSLKFSNTTAAGSSVDEYNIRIQDVGLLLRICSNNEDLIDDYGVDQLRQLGYVQIAEEALMEAALKINSDNGTSWEVHSSESHIVLRTCHDTTLALIRLASQIQQLFAPDVEESVVHLQNRWNSMQQGQGRDNLKGAANSSSDSFPSTSQVNQVGADVKSTAGIINLMDEICEEAFVSDGSCLIRCDSCGLEIDASAGGILHREGSNFCVRCPENILEDFNGPSSATELDGHQTSILEKAELMEGYYISDLRPLSGLTLNSKLKDHHPKSRLVTGSNADAQRGNSRWYGHSSIRIVENHMSDRIYQKGSEESVGGKIPVTDFPGYEKPNRFKGRVLLKNIGVKWCMYAGSDWNELRRPSCLSEDIRGRDSTSCLELVLSGMSVQYDIFPDGDICASKLRLSIQDFHLHDKSRHAPWKLVLGYYNSKERPRESSSKALKLDLESVRPDPSTPLDELRLRVALLPMLLHLHQSQLDFLVTFFGGNSSLVDQSQTRPQDSDHSSISSRNCDSKGVQVVEEALLPFFQKFDMWPLTLRVDYCPSHVDLAALSGGKYVELVNLVPWKGIELQLKHVQAVGVYGWSNAFETIIGEWLEDISQNQIHKLLQGLPTVRSVVAVGAGAAKLVSLPIKNYQRDHRLVKGLQRGTVAFLRSISLEALGLGVHLAAGAHEIMLLAEGIVTRIQPSVPWPVGSVVQSNVKSNMPEDAQHGFQQAYESLSEGFGKTASALVRTPLKKYQRGGCAGSALVTAVRGAPAAAIAPASAAAQALHFALLGVRNSLDPERKKESMNKYLGSPHSHSWEHS